MRTLHIFRGLPGCGKSTAAAALIACEPQRWIRINRDDLRGMVVGPGNNPHSSDKDREDLIRTVKATMMKQAFDSGYDVILDDTHLVPTTLKNLHTAAASYGDVRVIERAFNVDIETCLDRDSKRTGSSRVGEKVIRDMAHAAGIDRGRVLQDKEVHYPPRPCLSNRIGQDVALPKAILCDLDGTLALIGDRSPYDATDCDLKDLPNWPVVQCILAMHAQGYRIIFMSGRDQKYRAETERFIQKHCRVPVEWAFSMSNDERAKDTPIPYDLYMRGETAIDPSKMDTRKDSIIKRELFDRYIAGRHNVLFVLDDRDQVVDLWRSMGLVCFQVSPGSF
jgi:predicted kinase